MIMKVLVSSCRKLILKNAFSNFREIQDENQQI